jgi:SAM-dependent methyltransferase
MDYHKLYGPSVPEKGWVPAPRYLLRRQRLLEILAGIPPCSLMEVGCGPGVLIHELSLKGYDCTAVEMSQQALDLARYVNQTRNNVSLHNELCVDWAGNFDLLIACEVLEHIQDDKSALLDWCRMLNKGGRLLISVPCHMRKWTETDDWAGHYRRYEKNVLVSLMKECGYEIDRFECYGFPLANIIEPLRARMHARQLKQREAGMRQTEAGSANSRKEGNDASGVSRPTETRLYPMLCSWVGVAVMKSAYFIQDMFLDADIGNGYIVLATKK